jgi:Uma2 family endonuclease
MYTLTKWTIEDYHRMIAAGILNERRVELIQGEIIDMSPESPWHHFLNLSGAAYLRSLLGQQAIISEAHPITLTDSEPEPDIAVVRPPLTRYQTHHPYPEDIYWLIEIADSTLKKDIGLKRKVYAKVGIPEYWVIDIPHKTLKVWQNSENDDYQNHRDHQTGIIQPLAFPSLDIQVKKLIGVE